MDFKTIRKNHNKQIIIGLGILILLVSVITYTTTRAKYRSVQSVSLANGSVVYSIPDIYISQIKIKQDNEYVDSSEVPTSGYVLSTDSYCGELNNGNVVEDDNITINYHDGVIGFDNVTKKGTKCYLWFDIYNPTSEDTVRKLNVQNIKTGAPDFTSVATGAENTANNGVYKVADPMYATESNPNPESYYWRGAATTNYVMFAGKCWRIVRINGDGSIRLIYDGTTCHANGTNTDNSIVATSQTHYPERDRSEYAGYTFTLGSQRGNTTSSNLKIQTEVWFNNNDNFTAAQRLKVADGYFCNDRNATNWSSQPTSTFYYAAYTRINSNPSPTLDCSIDDKYQLKIGAITADEVMFAGGKGEINEHYYLYNGKDYWTMTPRQMNYTTVLDLWIYCVGPDGAIDVNSSNSEYEIRPVLNLKSSVTFNEGSNGTIGNPYIVQE